MKSMVEICWFVTIKMLAFAVCYKWVWALIWFHIELKRRTRGTRKKMNENSVFPNSTYRNWMRDIGLGFLVFIFFFFSINCELLVEKKIMSFMQYSIVSGTDRKHLAIDKCKPFVLNERCSWSFKMANWTFRALFNSDLEYLCLYSDYEYFLSPPKERESYLKMQFHENIHIEWKLFPYSITNETFVFTKLI